MKWRKIAMVVVIMFTLTIPALAKAKPQPPVERLFPTKMGFHNPHPVYGQYGINEFGFPLAITNHYAIHYEDGSLGACIVLQETTGEGFEDLLWLHIKVENLLTGEITWVNWQQTQYESTQDMLHYGQHNDRCDYASIVSPAFLLKHARITLTPNCDMPVLQYCQW